LYRKHVLVKLCELAQDLDLERITSTNDYELSQVNRRTITENCVTQVVCEIGQVPIWSSDLKLLPNIVIEQSQCDIRYYLLKKCDWNNDIIASNCTKKTTEMLYLLPSENYCQSSFIFYCKIPILCQSLAKSAQILLVMSDRTDTFRELWVLSILKCVI
jgi:hypothetical protein